MWRVGDRLPDRGTKLTETLSLLQNECSHSMADPTPQVTMPERWYYVRENDTLGPVSDAEIGELLSAKKIDLATLVARVGWTDWKPLAEITELLPERIDPIDQITTIDQQITHRPTAMQVGSRLRGSILGCALLGAALIAGFEIRWTDRKNELEARQMDRAQQVFDRAESWTKEGLQVPREVRGLSARDWARLEPEDFDRKEKVLNTAWQQYNEGKQMVSKVEGYRKQGAVIASEIANLSAVDWGLLPPGEFERKKSELDTSWNQFLKSKSQR